MNIFSKFGNDRDIINLTQDEQGHWIIKENQQQESDNKEPLIIHIGASPIAHIDCNIDHDTDHHFLDERHEHRGVLGHVGMVGIGDTKRELIETLQHIVEQEGHRGVIIIGAAPFERNIKEASLSDFAEKLIEETRQEIFLIQNISDNETYVDLKIKEINKGEQKYAKNHHKFHKQKPSGPKGQYSNSRRK